MRSHHVLFFLAVLFWQAAPKAKLVRDSTGRVQVSFVGGSGRYEDAQYDCSGDFVSADPVDVRAYGGRVDVVAAPQVRVTAAASTPAARGAPVGTAGWDQGAALGVQFAWESRYAGLGSGLTVERLGENRQGPNLYIRLGNANSPHFRLDVLEPNAVHYLMPYVKMGLGFGRGRERRTGGFMGIGWGPYADQAAQTLFVGELEIPVGQLDLLLRGHGGPGDSIAQWGIAGGLRLHVR